MDHPLRQPQEILAYRSLRQILQPKDPAKPRPLWTVASRDTVMAVLQIMADKNIGFLPVIDQDKLVGVVSERDCARRAALARKPLDTTPVADIMVREVITVDISQKFGDCLRLMHQHRIRHLPVTEFGKVVAVVSIRDLLSEAVAHNAKIIEELERERMTMLTSTV